VVGLDGGHVRSRCPAEERHFEVVAGKVIGTNSVQHRFAFARDSQAASAEALRQALAAAGVTADTPATVLCDGDAGLYRLRREVLAGATPVRDWWHKATRSRQRQPDFPHRFACSRLAFAISYAIPGIHGVPAHALTWKAKPRALSGPRSSPAARTTPSRRDAVACAAAMTAVVTGRISTRTPPGRSSQCASAGTSRVSMICCLRGEAAIAAASFTERLPGRFVLVSSCMLKASVTGSVPPLPQGGPALP
jgi:hypothetical protein